MTTTTTRPTITTSLAIKRRKGSYCARITGPDPKYHLARDFEDAKATKGLLTYALTPGFYEVCEGWVKAGEEWTKPRKYYRVNGTAEVIAADLTAYIAEAAAGPLPGEPGEWNGSECACGAPVTGFDTVGFPKCDEHTATTEAYGPALSPA